MKGRIVIKRPICIASFMYILGILIGLYLQISVVFLCISLIIFSIIVYLFTKKISYIVLILCVIIGRIYVYYIDMDYEKFFENITDEIEIKAIIVSEPEEKEYKRTYNIIVKELNGKKLENKKKLIFNLKKSNNELIIPKFGDEILIKSTIEKPSKARNYKGFNYETYLKSKKIYGTVESSSVSILSNNNLNIIDGSINFIQNNLENNMKKILGKDESALCVGILIGSREEISEKIEDNFKKSNLTHMLAVSGSHITYIITAFANTLGKTNKKLTKIFTIIFLIFFMALTGYTASVIRACIMGILVLIASIIYKKPDTINNLGISALIILLINPYIITDLGFLLSYGGTIGIVLLNKSINNRTTLIINMIVKKIKFLLNKKKNDYELIFDELDKKEHNEYGKLCNKSIKKNTDISNETRSRRTKDLNRISINDNKENKNESKFINTIIKYIIDSFSITFSANLIIIPIIAYSFSTFSFTFWISNIIAAPIMEIVTIFGFLIYFISLIIFPLAEFLGIFLNVLLSVLLKIAEITSLIPGASIYIKTPYLLECIIFYLIIAIIINKNKIIFFTKSINLLNRIKNNKLVINLLKVTEKNIKLFSRIKNKKLFFYIIMKRYIYKILLIFFITIFIFNFISNNISKKLKIHFVDVGQGDSTLIRTIENKTVLVDGGGSEFGSFDVGKSILLPYLLDRRITTIDYMIISHFDSDHIGGLFTIMENLNVRNIIISKQGEDSENLEKFQSIIKTKKINIIIVKQGDYIKIDKYSYIEILFPTEELIQENVLNNNSIVFKFNTIGLSILFTGDIEEIAEKQLVQMYTETNKLKSDILKVAHHGSKTSSTEKFLEFVSPKIALIGVGKDNNFGHPNSNVLERLRKYTNLIYRTDLNGEIIITINEKNFIIEKQIRNKEKLTNAV